jgi:hypothetical protein
MIHSNPPDALSATLRELAEALEQLAVVIDEQKIADQNVHLQRLSVLVKRFNQASDLLLKNEIAAKHRKGFLLNFLHHHGIETGDYRTDLNADKSLLQVADFLAGNFGQLKEFYNRLKYQQGQGKDFRFSNAGAALRYIRSFCNMLQKHRLIDQFRELDHAHIEVEVSTVATAIGFVNGYWLEILLRGRLAQQLKTQLDGIRTFDLLTNCEIVKPDNTPSELDLLLMMNEAIFWFECKSGHIGGEYIERFAEHRRLLGLPRDHCYLLIPESNAGTVRNMREADAMKVMDTRDLDTHLAGIIGRALLPSEEKKMIS